jgi:hypothetical protein
MLYVSSFGNRRLEMARKARKNRGDRAAFGTRKKLSVKRKTTRGGQYVRVFRIQG